MTPRDAPYHRLANLPRALWLAALTTSGGSAARRLADLPRWRDALEAGVLPPPEADCGDAPLFGALREAVGELDLPSLARGVPALAEQVLRTLLWHADRVIDRAVHEPRDAAVARAVRDFRDEWRIERADRDEALALLQGLGDLARLRWDELQGLWRRREWREAQRLAALLGRAPALVELLRRLGRREVAVVPRAPAPLPQAGRAAPVPLVAIETRLPDAPGEITGIRLSDRLERQLAAEAALMHHPVGHKLWRARRAESRLLTWESEAVLVDWRADPAARPRTPAAPASPPPLQRGPIVVCLDTSGSMAGAPEQLAKALVLQALRTAHAERRGCKLIAFGGPGEIVERDLDDGAAGLHALADLLGQGFDGGTDVQGPIERAVETVHAAAGAARWAGADLLIVSDGEFGCTAATLERLDAARDALGLRVQGILIGDRETMGLLEVCDDIFWVRDWRRFGGDAAGDFSPVHSRSLTAMYFPNALSERAARHRKG
ncbi:VWA domain-containing protein [Azohydromonas sp.]|uniref:VWA domain-containing protein n=1 Tax=Azohydromonas sp. TaxID=1872666 RepID=UPI002BD3EEA2|nr:VWA domain-containing protein [Azohydromonas sp.]HMM86034.1 VWA domain-containing protein [Azohydromonas sp.]